MAPLRPLSCMPLSLLVGWTLGMLPSEAAARDEPRTSSLSWERLPGAESCIATQDLARAVERRLRREVFVSAARADISVEGRVERASAPRGWRALVETRSPTGALLGTRELTSAEPSCEALSDPLVLVIAVMIDPDASLRPPPPRPPPPPPRVDPWRVDLGASVVSEFGLLPDVGVGAMVLTRIAPLGFWGFEGYGVVWAPQTVNADQGASTRVTLAYAGLSICPIQVESARHDRLAICAGVQGGALQAATRGFSVGHDSTDALWGAVAQGRFEVPITRNLFAQGGLQLVAPLRSDRFVYQEADGMQRELFHLLPVALVGDAGLGVSFP
jgi:hypothetical protein